MKRCLSAPPQSHRGRDAAATKPPREYTKGLFKSAKPVAFLTLLSHDFDIGEGETESGLCRFHEGYKRRYDILKYLVACVLKGQRLDALYAEIASMDVAEKIETQKFLQTTYMCIKDRQAETFQKVKKALFNEQHSLTNFWRAQVQDLDTNISQSIEEFQKRQAQELADEYQQVEKTYDQKRAHFSTKLLELWDQEPKLCNARAFNEARNIIFKGKLEEERQKQRFLKEIERQKALRLSWKVSQQMRQLNGVVDKMQRHRRQQEASREIEKSRLACRMKAALVRLERDQKEEIRRLSIYLEQHCFRMRHLVESQSRKPDPDQVQERKPLYMPRHDVSFMQPLDNSLYYPKCTRNEFVQIIFPASPRGMLGGSRASSPTSKADGHETLSSDAKTIKERDASTEHKERQRPQTASSLRPVKQNCDWCRRISKGPPCVLTEESDATTHFIREMDSYDFPMALTVQGEICKDVNATLEPAPKPIPERYKPEAPRKSRKNVPLSKLMDNVASGRALCKCCSWACCRLWNEKYSPPYLRGRRSLTIDLLKSKSRNI